MANSLLLIGTFYVCSAKTDFLLQRNTLVNIVNFFTTANVEKAEGEENKDVNHVANALESQTLEDGEDAGWSTRSPFQKLLFETSRKCYGYSTRQVFSVSHH